MIRIKVIDSAPESGCAFYRSIGPLSKLRHHRKKPNISVEYMSHCLWPVLSDADILFVSRPFDAAHVTAIKMAKDFGVPVWVDLDDNIHEMTKDNPFYRNLKANNTISNIEKSLTMADIVSVSTEQIADYYHVFNKNIK